MSDTLQGLRWVVWRTSHVYRNLMVETIVIEGPGASDSWIDRAESSSRVVIFQLYFEDPETDYIYWA